MKLIPGKSWVVVKGRYLGPGRINKIMGIFLWRTFSQKMELDIVLILFLFPVSKRS